MDEKLNYKDQEMLKIVPKNKKGVCLYSGGKDSGLALSIACENAEIVALINCCEKKHPMFHQHNIDLMEMDESYEFDDHLLNSSKGVYIAIFLIISISALIEVKHSIIKINLIKEEYKTISIKAFTNDHLYKHFFDIFLYFTGLIIDLNY